MPASRPRVWKALGSNSGNEANRSKKRSMLAGVNRASIPRGVVRDVLEAARRAAGHEHEGLGVEAKPQFALERVPRLVLVGMNVQGLTVARRDDVLEGGQCALGLPAADLEGQRPAGRSLDRSPPPSVRMPKSAAPCGDGPPDPRLVRGAARRSSLARFGSCGVSFDSDAFSMRRWRPPNGSSRRSRSDARPMKSRGVRSRAPAAALERVAEEEGADFLVVGTRGRGAMRSVLHRERRARDAGHLSVLRHRGLAARRRTSATRSRTA